MTDHDVSEKVKYHGTLVRNDNNGELISENVRYSRILPSTLKLGRLAVQGITEFGMICGQEIYRQTGILPAKIDIFRAGNSAVAVVYDSVPDNAAFGWVPGSI